MHRNTRGILPLSEYNPKAKLSVSRTSITHTEKDVKKKEKLGRKIKVAI